MKKPLKHYHRKKLYYKLFMLDSPYSAELTAFNAAFAALMLKPFALLTIAAMITGKYLTVYAVFPLLWLILSIIAFAIPISFRGHKKKHTLSWKSKEFYLKNCKFIFIFLAVFALFYFRFSYFSILIAFVSGTAFFVFGNGTKPLKKKAVTLSIFNVFFMIAIALLSYLSDDFMHDTAIEVTKIIGRDVTLDGYLKRERSAFQFDREPLKTLIKTYPEHEPELMYDILKSPLEARKKLLLYEKKYPAFTQSAKKFAALPPPQYGIGNKISPDKSLYMAKLFTGKMRETARYFAWQMQCSPTDRKLITDCNQKMQNIRGFCLNSNSLIYHLTGVAVESMRLQALVSTLQFNDINEAEFNKLLGKKIDWQEIFRYSYGDELTHMKSLIKYLLNSQALTFEENSYYALRNNIPHHFKIYLALNYNAFAKKIKNIISISKSNLSEKEKLAEFDKNDKGTGLLLCDMFGPTAAVCYKRITQNNDLRTIAETVFKIIDYRRKNGDFPENLNFLSSIPSDSIHGRKFLYEKGKINLYNNNAGFHGFIIAVDESSKYNKYSHCKLIVKSDKKHNL